jgi:hypothetical protein
MGTRRKVRNSILCVALLGCLAVFLVPAIRAGVLRAFGWWLVVDEAPPKAADVIVVALDANGAGTLYAADLVRQGVSNRVAVFDDPPDSVDREFLRRGVPYEDRASISTRQLTSLGVQSVEQISTNPTGSEEEVDVLPRWCGERKFNSVLLITLTDHSRRLQRILRRSKESHQTVITVAPSPYSPFQPDQWWKTREGVRIGIVELEKMFLDVIRHPFS